MVVYPNALSWKAPIILTYIGIIIAHLKKPALSKVKGNLKKENKARKAAAAESQAPQAQYIPPDVRVVST